MFRTLLLATLLCVSCASRPPAATPEPAPAAASPTETGAPSAKDVSWVEQSHPRPITIAALESAAQGRGNWLKADLKSKHGNRVRVSEEIAFEFRADRDASRSSTSTARAI